MTPVNARLLADERGIRVRVVSGDADPSRSPDFSFEVVSGEDGPFPPCHVRWDRHDAAIMEVDGFTLNSPLVGDVLITHHRDQPGVIGAVGTILARHDVNIAGMQVGRHLPRRGGEAIMVLNVDDAIPSEALDEMKGIAGIDTAFVVSLPQPSPQRPLFPGGDRRGPLRLVRPTEIGLAHEAEQRFDKHLSGHLHGVSRLGRLRLERRRFGPPSPRR